MISFIASALSFVCVVWMAGMLRAALRRARLADRQTLVLAHGLTVTQIITAATYNGDPPDPEQIEKAMGPAMVAIADEFYAQSQLSRWRLPPRVGEPWPPGTPPAPLGDWDGQPFGD